ncbi:protein SOB FIVE-LIKE 4-like [Diospyros lotus]|uniref:protein SOB FIVE-LIKE 4-like n=1 Tax=Diospyros lotus TaxID=55363 RepID=UPI00225C1BFC|nr:protein SOB FIVE-LIKE 4-like [Diospyros lotus]
MESPHIFVDAEECQSSESGWTMYICSPSHHSDDDDSDDDDDGEDDYYEKNHGGKPDQDDSDDSMASDASSGPSHQEQSWRNGKAGGYKNDGKKAKNPVLVDKNGFGRSKQKKDQSAFAARGASVNSIQSNDEKERKTSKWFGKRK